MWFPSCLQALFGLSKDAVIGLAFLGLVMVGLQTGRCMDFLSGAMKPGVPSLLLPLLRAAK